MLPPTINRTRSTLNIPSRIPPDADLLPHAPKSFLKQLVRLIVRTKIRQKILHTANLHHVPPTRGLHSLPHRRIRNQRVEG